jgi:hypothetical protein
VGPHPHALPLDGSKTRRSRRPQALAFQRFPDSQRSSPSRDR